MIDNITIKEIRELRQEAIDSFEDEFKDINSMIEDINETTLSFKKISDIIAHKMFNSIPKTSLCKGSFQRNKILYLNIGNKINIFKEGPDLKYRIHKNYSIYPRHFSLIDSTDSEIDYAREQIKTEFKKHIKDNLILVVDKFIKRGELFYKCRNGFNSYIEETFKVYNITEIDNDFSYIKYFGYSQSLLRDNKFNKIRYKDPNGYIFIGKQNFFYLKDDLRYKRILENIKDILKIDQEIKELLNDPNIAKQIVGGFI